MIVELLTEGPDGHAIPGRMIDYTPGQWRAAGFDHDDARETITAVMCKFTWKGSVVRFFVPKRLLEEVEHTDGYRYDRPTEKCMRLINERLEARG